MISKRSVDSTPYHIWTDALHGRALARQATNEWDRGTYVRWAIVSAWTTLEIACADALRTPRIGDRFKERIDEALVNLGLNPLVWGGGVWQRVLEIQQLRINFVHRHIAQEGLFTPLEYADKAISVVRDAVKDVYAHAGQTAPEWIDVDDAAGWAGGIRGAVHAKVIRAGAREDDPTAVKIAYIYNGEEFVTELLPAGTDPEPVLKRLIEEVVIPISSVRAYVGGVLAHEIRVRMRGSS